MFLVEFLIHNLNCGISEIKMRSTYHVHAQSVHNVFLVSLITDVPKTRSYTVTSLRTDSPLYIYIYCVIRPYFTRGGGDLSFFEYLSPFYFLSIQFHWTFSISYKILPYFVYYCIFIRY